MGPVRPKMTCCTVLGIVLGFLGTLAPFSSSAWAQKYVFSNASFATGLRPEWVVTGDFNKDGIEDVAVVNECGNDGTCLSAGSISILLGNPDGTFQSHVDYATGSVPRFAIAADFNGDGILDLAVVNTGSNTISIFIGNGDGTFQSHVDYPTGAGPVSIVAGDFNGDHKLDLAVANSGSSSVSILLGIGDGTFQSHVDHVTSFPPKSIATADFNGDGKPDLAVADLNVSVLLGNGDGTFQSPAEYPGAGATFVAVGDFNGDGKYDLASADGFDDRVSILLGNGDGTFQTPAVTYEVGGGPTSVLAIDLNGDGHMDLAVGTGAGGGGPNVAGTLSVLLNKGDGTFQPHRDFGGMTAVSVAAGDFNGDAQVDLAVPNPDFNTVNILLGDGRGTFGSILDYGTQVVPPSQVIAGDFNGDGKLDLCVALQASGIVGVFLGNGDGTFQPPMLNNAPGGGLYIAAGDFDGDGKLDVAAFVGSELNNMQILLGNGDGTFKPRIAFPVSNNPGQVLTGDFNGDGKLDLLPVGSGFGVLRGNGDGTFQSASVFSSHLSSGALVADFNGDRKEDLAVVSSGFNTVTIFLGNGDGTFQPGVDYPTGTTNTAPVAIVAADFNGDGKLDLAVANTAANTISVFLGNGDGTFQPHADFPAIQSLRSLAAADFDGDGKIDLMAVGNGISFLFGNGDGTFRTHLDYLTSINVASAISADFNGDGRPDLAIANLFASSASVLLNHATVALRPNQLNFLSQQLGTSSAPQTVTIYNPGMLPLHLQNITLSGDFSQTNTCGVSVAPGANCIISVTFTPTTAGPRTASATITDDAPGSPQMISITGSATVPVAGASPSSLTFTEYVQPIVNGQPQPVTLTNSGSATLNIASVTATPADFPLEGGTCSNSLRAGQSCMIFVLFEPTSAGAIAGTLTITDDSGNSPQTVSLSGIGQDFSVAASGATNATITAGQTATYSIAVVPLGGFSQSIALSCSGAPALSTCMVTPSTVQLNGTSTVMASIAVTTTARGFLVPHWPVTPTGLRYHPAQQISALLGMFLLLIGLLSWKRKKQFKWTPLFTLSMVLVCLGMTLTACGGGSGGSGGSTGTQAGTYTITTFGSFTSGSTTLTHTTKLTMVVQ